jgi:leucyl-tRNA synthetase
MSKSKGIFITLKEALSWYGADVLRLTLMDSPENLDDLDFRKENLRAFSRLLNNLYSLVTRALEAPSRENKTLLDSWLLSKLQKHIIGTTDTFEKTKFKTAIHHTFFSMVSDLKTYLERSERVNKNLVDDFLSVLVRLIAPITPHLAEELWSRIGRKPFILLAEWPKIDEKLIDEKILELEEIFGKTVEDLRHVVKLVGKKESAYLYFSTQEELEYFKENLEFVRREFGFGKLEPFLASDEKRYDPQNKASKAKPGKPGIYLE